MTYYNNRNNRTKDALRSHMKTRASGCIRSSKHLQTIKALGGSGLLLSSVSRPGFETPDETLALVVDILPLYH